MQHNKNENFTGLVHAENGSACKNDSTCSRFTHNRAPALEGFDARSGFGLPTQEARIRVTLVELGDQLLGLSNSCSGMSNLPELNETTKIGLRIVTVLIYGAYQVLESMEKTRGNRKAMHEALVQPLITLGYQIEELGK
jgi:hypothetical protein